MRKREKAFTLIELMVVIAIIAILVTAVLVSLRGAREAAEDVTRIAALSQMRSFPTQERLERIEEEYGPQGEDILLININEEEKKYCATIELKEGGYFCVDSSLAAEKIESPDCEDHFVCKLSN